MSDLLVVGILSAKPGSEQLLRDALTTLTAATRQEAGCRSYDLYESGAEPGTFFTVEAWGAQSDLDGHMKTDHVKAAFAAVGDQLAAAPAIHPLTPVDVTG